MVFGNEYCKSPDDISIDMTTAANENARKQIFDALVRFIFEGSFLAVSTFGRTANTSSGMFAELCTFPPRSGLAFVFPSTFPRVPPRLLFYYLFIYLHFGTSIMTQGANTLPPTNAGAPQTRRSSLSHC